MGLRGFAGAAAATFAALALSACAATHADDGRPIAQDRLLAHFEAVAFGDQYDPKHDITRLRKWNGPVRIALQGEEAPRHRAAIERNAAELSGLTGLSIGVADTPGAANFEIRFVAWDDMEKEARAFAPRPDWLGTIVEGAACLFIFRRTERYEILRALVLVSTRESDDHKTRCLLEEMTQALGLPNDSDALKPSIFNSFDRLSALTRADRILVRLLYDRRLQAGMPRAEALRRAHAIIGELAAGNAASRMD